MTNDPDRRSRFERAQQLLVSAALITTTLACGPVSDDTRPELSTAERERRELIRLELRERLGDGYEQMIPTATSDQLVRGARVYAKLCSGCHGPDGGGDGRAAATLPIKPADLARPAGAALFSDAARLEIIRGGISGSTMIGWGDALEEADLLAVFQFVRSLEQGTGS